MKNPKDPVGEKEGLSQREMSRLGGIARANALGAERRREIASLAGRISAKKKKLKKKLQEQKNNENKRH